MKKFTEIGQFGQMIGNIRSHHDYHGKDENGDNIYLHQTPYPAIRFRATVKNHGTNAGIALYKDGHYEFQSRENQLSLEKDNAGFMREMSAKPYQKLFDGIEFNDHCIIYGEWIGKGVQGKVAIAELSKRFIIFAVRIDDVYQDMENYKHLQDNDNDIYNILQFPHWYFDIDFNHPELMQNAIIEKTLEVEDECPVAKYFGISGIGEGIVIEGFDKDGNRYIAKSKGVKHANSKVKVMRVVDNDKINALMELADKVTPSWRLDQMFTDANNLMNGGLIDRKNLGNYIKMVIADVQKEETDVITEAGYEIKDIGKYISDIAKNFFFEQEKLSIFGESLDNSNE